MALSATGVPAAAAGTRLAWPQCPHWISPLAMASLSSLQDPGPLLAADGQHITDQANRAHRAIADIPGGQRPHDGPGPASEPPQRPPRRPFSGTPAVSLSVTKTQAIDAPEPPFWSSRR